jgi:hypothetical protein
MDAKEYALKSCESCTKVQSKKTQEEIENGHFSAIPDPEAAS